MAQDDRMPGAPSGRPTTDQGWSVTVGVAPVVSSAWEGSNDYVLSVFPDLRINYGDTIFASIPDGIGGSLVRPLGQRSAITAFTSLERLGGVADSSPLVEERGRSTQFTAALGYGYRF